MRSILIAIILALSSVFFAGYFYYFFGDQSEPTMISWCSGLRRAICRMAPWPESMIRQSSTPFERTLDAHDPVAACLLSTRLMPRTDVHAVRRPAASSGLGGLGRSCRWRYTWPAAGMSSGRGRWLLLAALIAPSTVSSLMFGQTGLLTGGLTMLGFSLLKRSPVLSGVAFGLLSAKPQLAALPLLVLLLSGNRTAAKSAIVTIVLLVLAGLAAFQSDDWADWMESLSGFSTGVFRILLALSTWHHGLFHLAQPGRSAGTVAQLQSRALSPSACAAGKVDRACIAASRTAALWPSNDAALASACSLATPYALVYDLPVISVPCA